MLPVNKTPFFSIIQNGVCAPADSGMCEGLVLTSDSESEIFCDSVDSVEQLGSIKVRLRHITNYSSEQDHEVKSNEG